MNKPVFVLGTRPLAAAPPVAIVERMSGARPTSCHSFPLAASGKFLSMADHHSAVSSSRSHQRIIITRVPVLIGAVFPLFSSLPVICPQARRDTAGHGLVRANIWLSSNKRLQPAAADRIMGRRS